ncbi:DHA1 family bicyclomycin/chloramphenicol resistance-like MFS transporter [Aurantimicrobium minutum]|uniref:multidrug effflux MFS transporter n=1 Tax=Aurantimicrobium minutum TaxID=708131 RepID=UPI002476783B|nr:multidrug effflux MFS transporter [Aurantimicrobium minutum]MDH6532799.1 DHA1 family bicyclomycin/chloramphenicol resistance-like MFS transporter [Aurantimicrobium minutum]
MTSPIPAPSRAIRAWRLFVLGSLTMFGAVCIDLYLPAFPHIADALGVEVNDMGLTLTSFLLGMGIGQLFYGPVSDRFGRKRPLLVGIIVFVIASVMCATSTTLMSLIMWRFIQALGASAGIVISRAIVRDLYSGIEMAKVMTILGMVFALGPALAPSIGALVLLSGVWQWAFYSLAIFGAFMLIGVMTLPETHHSESRNNHGFIKATTSYGEILTNKVFLTSALLFGADFAGFFSYVSSSPDIMMGVYGLNSTVYALVFGVISLSLLVGSQINLRILPRFGNVKLLKVYTSIQIVGSILVLTAALVHAPLFVVLVPLLLVSSVASSIAGLSMTASMTPFAHLAGSASAMNGMIQMASAGIITAVLAVLPFDPVIQMAAVMVIAITAAFFLARSRAIPDLAAARK